MAIDFMSTQTGGEGETIQAEPTMNVDPQQFNVDIPAQQQQAPQPQQAPQVQQAQVPQVQQEEPQVQQVNPYEELGLQDAGVQLPEYATAQEIDIKKPTQEVTAEEVVEVPDSNSSFTSETADGEIIIEENAGTTVDGETIIDPSAPDTQAEEQAIDQEYKDTPIKLKHSRVLFNKPKGEYDDGDDPKKPKKDGIYKLSWQPEAVFKKEGDVWGMLRRDMPY